MPVTSQALPPRWSAEAQSVRRIKDIEEEARALNEKKFTFQFTLRLQSSAALHRNIFVLLTVQENEVNIHVPTLLRRPNTLENKQRMSFKKVCSKASHTTLTFQHPKTAVYVCVCVCPGGG